MLTLRLVLILLLAVLASGCERKKVNIYPESGISLGLATARVQTIKDIHYDISFEIPDEVSEPILGSVLIRFELTETKASLVLDFAPGRDFVESVTIDGSPSSFRAINGHIVIPAEELVIGENSVNIAFRPGEASLNRDSEFVYTLFVPARAHLAFPSFDQPDLKAKFKLVLTIPSDWEAVANSPEIDRKVYGDKTRIRYAETQPIPTYLFAFTTGKFHIETDERNGREYRMFHRETDETKVERNRDEVFDLHASALEWLERYTRIEYPFEKFDFVLIPSFQFGGMEHPGVVFYNQNRMLLDESVTQKSILTRANLIAHETAHMWFGNLVTMRWFNDVWMKEVFANFMAEKIVNPMFPDVNHNLRFLVAHYPSAYAVDRTEGTHPIRQSLENLDKAGSLYGAIIYEKAPIVMRQLERILGANGFRDGVQTYLKTFQFSNATWNDLVFILDEYTELDLGAWSRTWVEEAGLPLIRTELTHDSEGGIEQVDFVQSDSMVGRDCLWIQQIEIAAGTDMEIQFIPLEFESERLELDLAVLDFSPEFILPTGNGLAYGHFVLDNGSRRFLLENLPSLVDPVIRGAAWITLWEELLEGRVPTSKFIGLALRALPREQTEQNVQLILEYLNVAFWKFLSDEGRQNVAATLEKVLSQGFYDSDSPSMKSTYFFSFRSVVTTSEGIAFLEGLWKGDEEIAGLTLAENDEAAIALDLAVRSVPDASRIVALQLARFKNLDNRSRFEFVMPAVSGNQDTRDSFFESLFDEKNRAREPWVLQSLGYLHHPLRATKSEKYLLPALELLREIRRTGDIFFPTRWMAVTLDGHNSEQAADVVSAFLRREEDYPIPLRRIILQAADPLFRAVKIRGK